MKPHDEGKKEPRTAWRQIHPRLPAELNKRLRIFAGAKGASQAAVIQAALTRYLDTDDERAMIIRRLNRLSRGVTRVHRDVTVVADALAVFVQVWLAHTPRLPEADRARAERAALTRFAQFTEHVAARIASGRSVMTDLVPEDLTDADEPPAAAGAADRGESP